MKKQMFALLLLLVMVLAVPVQAKGTYIQDEAGILTPEQRQALEDTAAEIGEEYQCGVYFISVHDLALTGKTDVREAAKHRYLGDDLGIGSGSDGVLLLMSMDDRKMALITYGYGNTAITDQYNQMIRDAMKKDFRDDNWYEGLKTYLEMTGDCIQAARAGKDYHPRAGVLQWLPAIGICVLAGTGSAWLVVSLMEKKLKSVAVGTDAAAYAGPDSLKLTLREDQYTGTTTHRSYSPRNKDSSSGGGGGGTTVDSDGFGGSSDSF